MEYYYYIFLLIITLGYAFSFNSHQSKKKDLWFFLLLMALSVIVRQNLQSDMPGYAEALHYPLKSFFKNQYYQKNILYWLGSAVLYQEAFFNERCVFIFWDFICSILLIRIRKNWNLPYWFIPFYFLTFLMVLNYQNGFRQYIAIIFTTYSYTIIHKRKFLGYIFFFLACTIHAATYIFIGLIFIYRKETGIKAWLLSIIILATMVITPIVAQTDYMFNTGLNLNPYYALLTVAISIYIFFASKLSGNFKLSSSSKLQGVLYLVTISLSAFSIMGSSLYYERLSTFIILLLLPTVVSFSETASVQVKPIIRLAIILLFTVPTFAFKATDSMLNNAESLNPQDNTLNIN